MRAIDTNVLVRVLLGDEPKSQVDSARALLASTEKGERVFISGFVLLETAWVLKSKGRSAADIAVAFDAILHTEGIVVSLRSQFLAAVARFRELAPQVGIADCLILADAAEHDALPLFSFDEALCRAEPQRVLPPAPCP
jgi:predicted nucleic-acid-binding protein